MSRARERQLAEGQKVVTEIAEALAREKETRRFDDLVRDLRNVVRLYTDTRGLK